MSLMFYLWIVVLCPASSKEMRKKIDAGLSSDEPSECPVEESVEMDYISLDGIFIALLDSRDCHLHLGLPYFDVLASR